MEDAELLRLLVLSQSDPSDQQRGVLASHFGLVASELVVLRRKFEQAKVIRRAAEHVLESIESPGPVYYEVETAALDELREVLEAQ